mgnify:CR=1 FL=1
MAVSTDNSTDPKLTQKVRGMYECRTSRIQEGWYTFSRCGFMGYQGFTLHMVRTDSYGDDFRWDWIVTDDVDLAKSLASCARHGGRVDLSLHEVMHVANRLSDCKAWSKAWSVNPPMLHCYKSGAEIRPATKAQIQASEDRKEEIGVGVILVDRIACYVESNG